MVLLDKLWDDALGGPTPEQGLGRLRKLGITIKEGESSSGSLSMPSTPMTPSTPATPTTPRTDNVWNRMCHPGSASRNFGSEFFDNPKPNSPTVYDWMYSDDTRTKSHR